MLILEVVVMLALVMQVLRLWWRVNREYVEFFNTARPHQGIDQQIPIAPLTLNFGCPVRCCNVRGGIIHDYYRDAA